MFISVVLPIVLVNLLVDGIDEVDGVDIYMGMVLTGRGTTVV